MINPGIRLAVALVAVMAAGCPNDKKESCGGSRCPAGSVCVSGTCKVMCDNDTSCPSGQYCSLSSRMCEPQDQALDGPTIIARINEARRLGATLDADTLGGVSAAALATQSELDTAAGALTTQMTGLDTRLGTAQSGIDRLLAVSPWHCPGTLVRGVCVADYNRSVTPAGYVWGQAVTSCSTLGARLCSTSQYAILREGSHWGDKHLDLFYDGKAVWTANFSDNDAGIKSWAISSSDDPTETELYAYACCRDRVPEPYRSRMTRYRPTGAAGPEGVAVTYLHAVADTSFPTAAQICAGFGSDLCTKSQYVALNDNRLFGGTSPAMPVWTNEQSDNDARAFDPIVATNDDNPPWSALYAYACCGSQRPLDGSCPVTAVLGVCPLSIESTATVSFFDAARACARLGADVCSKAEMHVLRNNGRFSGPSWTNDGADNDSNRAGGLLAGDNTKQPDNPIPTATLMGYACCL